MIIIPQQETEEEQVVSEWAGGITTDSNHITCLCITDQQTTMAAIQR